MSGGGEILKATSKTNRNLTVIGGYGYLTTNFGKFGRLLGRATLGER